MGSCRICLLKLENDFGTDIFQATINEELLSSVITTVANVEVSENDSLPRLICHDCWKKLYDVYFFRALIVKSDLELRQRPIEDIPGQLEISDPSEISEQLEIPEQDNSEIPEQDNSEEHDDIDQNTILLVDHKVEKEEIDEHEDEAPKTKKTSHACQQCGKLYLTSSLLKRHIKSHSGEKPFQCEICDRRYATKQSLENHKNKHSDECKYSCETCGKGFRYPSGLITHRKIHLGIKNFKCDVCDKAFVHNDTLRSHKKSVHVEDRNFVCEYCSFAFKSAQVLFSHQKVKHSKQLKMEDCPICGKSFMKYYLKPHVLKHTSGKPFECTICAQRFTEKGSLNTHIIRVHEGRKPFECEICGKKFPIKYERYLHMRVHTKEKPFPCSSCEMAFSYKHHLNNHIQRKHGNNRGLPLTTSDETERN